MKTLRLSCTLLLPVVAALAPVASADESDELVRRLADVRFVQYAASPTAAGGLTWRKGEILFSGGGLYRVDAEHKVHKYLELNPVGTVLRGDGHVLMGDSKHKALLDLSPDGKVGVLAERWEMESLRSLQDLAIDARGNVYWTDPEGSTLKTPTGRVYRLRPDGRVDRMAVGLVFPTGIAVDPTGKYLFVIDALAQKVLRYEVPADNDLLGKPEVFCTLAGTGSGCRFDAAGRLWVAENQRPGSDKGHVAVFSAEGKPIASVTVPGKVVNHIAFGGSGLDELLCATGEPNGLFHARVGCKGFAGHPGKPAPIARTLNVVVLQPHVDAPTLRKLVQVAAEAKIDEGQFDPAAREQLKTLAASLTDAKVRTLTEPLLPFIEQAAIRHARDRRLLAEIKRLGGTATIEVQAPDWLRSLASDEGLAVFGRLVELDLNERTDGHKEPVPKKLSDRVTDDWLKQLAGQDQLRRLELSGTAITSAGLVHLKDLSNLERLNICLTAVDDRGFEHLAGMAKMRRMVICASKITGTGFAHLGGMKQLESINLHSAPASDAGLEAIGKLTSLRRLEIVHTKVTDAGLKHLAGLVHLQQLHVHGPETTAMALPFLGQLQELYQLDVYDKAASNQTLEQIAKLPHLRLLSLVLGTFDDDGVKHLAKLTTLEELSLDSPQMTDASIEHLRGLHNLRKLHLGRARITAAGRQRLSELLPKLVIMP
jgi:sugar lactone lactonase YvrE